MNASTFRTHLRESFSHCKPVAVTEYGACAYRGAGDLAAWLGSHHPGAVLERR